MRPLIAIACLLWGTNVFAQFDGVWEVVNLQETRGLHLELLQRGSSVCGIWWENDFGVIQAGDIKGEVAQDAITVQRCWSRPITGASRCPRFAPEAERITLDQDSLVWTTSAFGTVNHQFRLTRKTDPVDLLKALPDGVGTKPFVTACMKGANLRMQPNANGRRVS
jgi:hypothetical protein